MFEFIKPLNPEKDDRWLASVMATQDGLEPWSTKNGKLIIHLKDDSELDLFGCRFVCPGTASPLVHNRNPASFCYSGYLENEFGVSHILYSSTDSLRFMGRRNYSLARSLALSRKKLAQTLDRVMHQKSNSAIMKAMLLGQKQNLDENQKTSFRNAGVFFFFLFSGLYF
ncbi:MAG: hypothetical protein HKN09_10275 [Saprospiraceae bacterium]|nr:hypothetical protein [Saprospiraceae bacterium]